jgi:hypothetical protein
MWRAHTYGRAGAHAAWSRLWLMPSTWGTAEPLTPAHSKPLHCDNGFLNVFPFLTQRDQHF